jgi:hypothetical protein
MREARRYPATTGRFASRPHPACSLPPRRTWSASRDTGRDRAWCTGKRATSRLACDGLSNLTAAPGCLAGADGDGTHVRVQVLTNAGALYRDKQLAVISQLTAIVAAAAGDPSLAGRTRALLTEAPTADRAWPATPPTPSSPKAGAEIASVQPRTGN